MVITFALYLVCAFLLAAIVVFAACIAAGRADIIRHADERHLDQTLRLRRLGNAKAKRLGDSLKQPIYPR